MGEQKGEGSSLKNCMRDWRLIGVDMTDRSYESVGYSPCLCIYLLSQLFSHIILFTNIAFTDNGMVQ